MNRTRVARLLEQDVVIYIRPVKRSWIETGKTGIAWTVTAERADRGAGLLHYKEVGDDLDVVIENVCSFAERTLGIKKKTRKRARRTL